MNLLGLLTSNSLPIAIGALISTGGMLIKTYNDSARYNELETKYITISQGLQRCTEEQAVVQAKITEQANEIQKYNDLAGRYRKELETKYQVINQPTIGDFSALNELLARQGIK